MEDLSHSRKAFSHSTIKWNIKPFCLTIPNDDYRILSPEFYIKAPQLTKWRLIFLCADRKVLSVHLEMLEPEPNFENIWINWKLCLIHKDEEISVQESFYQFTRNTRIDTGSYKIKDMLEKLQPFGEEELNLQWYLCASLEHVNEVDNFDDALSLSKDLSCLYRENKNCDIVLKVRDSYYIPAHKAILISRNNILANRINQKHGKRVIHIPEVDYEIMEAILEYFYSRSLQPLMNKPPNLIHKCALLFDIPELLNHAFSDQRMFSSSIKAKRFSFGCKISDLNGKKEVCFKPSPTEGTWYKYFDLSLRQVNAQIIDISFSIASGGEKQHVCFDIGIFDAEQKILLENRHCRYLNGRERMFVFSKTMPANFLNISSFINCTFRIILTIRLTQYEEIQMAHSGDPFKTVICENCKVKFYTLLSTNMKSLLENPIYADIRVIANKAHLPAHKCILSARSSFLSQKINEMNENNQLKISNITERVFRVILQYIYSGTLENFNATRMKLIYRAAGHLGIPTLKCACSRRLQKTISVQNVAKIFQFADGMQDIELKDSAMHFIRSNLCDVVNQNAWKNVVKVKPNLLIQFNEFLEKNS